jgi:hypothetical protein
MFRRNLLFPSSGTPYRTYPWPSVTYSFPSLLSITCLAARCPHPRIYVALYGLKLSTEPYRQPVQRPDEEHNSAAVRPAGNRSTVSRLTELILRHHNSQLTYQRSGIKVCRLHFNIRHFISPATQQIIKIPVSRPQFDVKKCKSREI